MNHNLILFLLTVINGGPVLNRLAALQVTASNSADQTPLIIAGVSGDSAAQGG
jgi:hypothetical protein